MPSQCPYSLVKWENTEIWRQLKNTSMAISHLYLSWIAAGKLSTVRSEGKNGVLPVHTVMPALLKQWQLRRMSDRAQFISRSESGGPNRQNHSKHTEVRVSIPGRAMAWHTNSTAEKRKAQNTALNDFWCWTST